jgi:hypothetical protein
MRGQVMYSPVAKSGHPGVRQAGSGKSRSDFRIAIVYVATFDSDAFTVNVSSRVTRPRVNTEIRGHDTYSPS